MAFAHRRAHSPLVRNTIRVLVLLSLSGWSQAAAQVVSYADVTVIPLLDFSPPIGDPFDTFGPFGCTKHDVGTGGFSAAVDCSVPKLPGGAGTLNARGVASYDPSAGTIKSSASLTGHGYTLSQFIPGYDATTGDQIFTGAVRPDGIFMGSQLEVADDFTFHPKAGLTPAGWTLLFSFDLNGSLTGGPQPADINTFAYSATEFCITPIAGLCDGGSVPGVYAGGVQEATVNGSTDVACHPMDLACAQPWIEEAGPRTVLAFSGTTAPDGINGRLVFGGIPLIDAGHFDFRFYMLSEVALYHRSLAESRGCDPALDPDCIAIPPADVDGTISADFSHTATFAGFTVLDADGNDVTSLADIEFGSGLKAPSAPVVATPEPATTLLVGSGLAVLALARRRRFGQRAA